MQGNNSLNALKFHILVQKCLCMSFCLIFISYDKSYHTSSESNISRVLFLSRRTQRVQMWLYTQFCKLLCYILNTILCVCSVLPTKILPKNPQQDCRASPSKTAVFSLWMNLCFERIMWTNESKNSWTNRLIKTFTAGSFSFFFRASFHLLNK